MLILVAVLVSCNGSVLYRYHSKACKQRGAAYQAKAEKLKSDAHEKLRLGTKKEDVIRSSRRTDCP
jgi:hypothetical protein